jgi:hypothetical protein
MSFVLLIKRFLSLPLWKKVIFSSIISAIGSGTIIGFSSRFSLYYYAYKQGIRVPLEGVEYLSVSVGIISSIAFLFTTFGALTIDTILKLLGSKLMKKIFPDKRTGKENVLTNSVSVFLIIVLFYFFGKNIPDLIGYNGDLSGFIGLGLLFTKSIAIVLLILIVYFLPPKPGFRYFLTKAVVFVGICGVLITSFNQRTYKSFLEKIKYGGDTQIIIEYRKADNSEDYLTGGLLLKTKKYLIIKSNSPSMITEIPLNRVSKVDYIDD